MQFSRRAFVKALATISTALVVVPFITLEKYFRVPGAGVVKVKRMKIANRADLAQGKAMVIKYPNEKRPALLIHLGPGEYEVGNYWEETKSVTLDSDRFVCYDGICTHLGCPVDWMEDVKGMGPSCHGANFSPIDGSVRAGPPRRPLPKIRIEIDGDGNIYANGYESGLPLYGWENVRLEEEG